MLRWIGTLAKSPWLAFVAVALVAVAGAVLGCGSEPQPWFGLSLPPGLSDPHQPVVSVADVTRPPAAVPAGEQGHVELAGPRIRTDLETITGFSRQDRAAGNQMWGRVTGRRAAAETLAWVAEQFEAAGLSQVELQSYRGTDPMWWPRAWEVRLLADPEFGPGSRDVVLESALPAAGSHIPGGSLVAPLVEVGVAATEAIPDLDLTGKVAVQRLRPASGAYAERLRIVERARRLLERGAVAVLNVVEQTGNLHVRDFSSRNGPCFNLGTADGAFLAAVMDRVSEAGAAALRVELRLETESLTDLTGHNAVGVVEGHSDENIIVNAHGDGWFDAAGDNGDGLAVLLALARHFSRPENRPDRSLVFVASGGHHSRGLNGPANFVDMNPDLTQPTVLVLNLEHVAQSYIRSEDWSVDAAEQPMNFGIDNEAPFLIDVGQRGMERYGFNLNPSFRAAVPGDLGGYSSLGVPRVQAIHAGPMYHTSGDVLETISVPGLERAARFYAFFLREVGKATRGEINGAQ